jgi:glycosyltransferase involved in cell wall biosynthesis
MVPISVLLPTRDCGALIPGHLQSMAGWIDLAEEVVVVDSNSKDNTVELIRQGLAHPRIRFLSHPPGLYQSWNFGIQNARAKYLYISTVGDSISRQGLEHLFEAAERLQSDVVISKPEFVNEAGAPLPDDRWPIDEILDQLKIQRPQLLAPQEQFLFAVIHAWGAILGSSASDLYRTECLQARPFPTDYGTAGDGGWGIQNIFDIKIAVVPGSFSTFRRHAKAYSLKDYHVESLALKFLRLAQSVAARRRASDPRVSKILEAVHWPELEPVLDASAIAQDNLERLRRGKTPWFLQPAAWQARRTRTRARCKITAITTRVLSARQRTTTL